MQAKTSVPDAVVIGRDDGHPLYVQATVQNGRRHLDIRPWRRSSVGFAALGPGMSIDADKIVPLEHGIAELLAASNGGRQVARVVWDDKHGRRLRAEVEPFGLRFLARLGFWQRGRDTWHQIDDGLLLSAEHLIQLRDVLHGFHAWVCDPDPQAALAETIGAERELLHRWPAAGADWLTAEADRIAFHPRGIRVTCTLIEREDGHRISVCQWRRHESLWLPDMGALFLVAADLDAVLGRLAGLTDRHEAEGVSEPEAVACRDGSSLRLSLTHGERSTLLVEQRNVRDGVASDFEVRLTMPAEYIPRFGRALAQSWSLLAASLPPEERADLTRRADPWASERTGSRTGPAVEDAITSAKPPRERAHEAEVAIDTEMSGASTLLDPEGTEPATVLLAPELHDLIPERVMEEPVLTPEASEDPQTGESAADAQDEQPLYVRLRTLALGTHRVALSLQGSSERPEFTLAWADRALHVPLESLGEMLLGLRALYYDALRGRRGRALVVGQHPSITITIDNHGSGLYCDWREETDAALPMLSFPASEVPLFLDAAEAALALR